MGKPIKVVYNDTTYRSLSQFTDTIIAPYGFSRLAVWEWYRRGLTPTQMVEHAKAVRACETDPSLKVSAGRPGKPVFVSGGSYPSVKAFYQDLERRYGCPFSTVNNWRIWGLSFEEQEQRARRWCEQRQRESSA